MNTNESQAQTLGLNTRDKIRLVEMLLESFDKPDPKIEAAGVSESERRYGAYKREEIKG